MQRLPTALFASCKQQVTRFNQDGATFDTEGFVGTHVWTALPETFGVASMFVFKNAINNKYFFTTEMSVGIEVRAWSSAHQSRVSGAKT